MTRTACYFSFCFYSKTFFNTIGHRIYLGTRVVCAVQNDNYNNNTTNQNALPIVYIHNIYCIYYSHASRPIIYYLI